MRMPTDPEVTLPSIIASMASKYGGQELVLTIVFHPDTSRIGHRAVVPQQTGNAPWVLGRRSPDFDGPDGQCPTPLDDPHVSRRALQFTLRGKRLVIRRFDASSRCRLGSTELYDSVEVEWERLREGLPVMLGHSVVLLLRVGRSDAPFAPDRATGSLLRGSSACMADIREQVARAGESDLDVLVRGETGTGKELVAASIHNASRRAKGPMVSVNMAAIPSELAAAALFGSARGAFTGANQAVPGYFEQAQGGTLFLDEIGDASVEVQPQLLRALQEREIQAVGGPIRRVDVRVISATDAALDDQGSDFKAALRHRLGACEILVPPLREHPEDIGELLLYFLQNGVEESGRSGFLPEVTSAATDIAAWAMLFYAFLSYRWPGNVRELANFAQQVVMSSEARPVMNQTLWSAMTGPNSPSSFSGRVRRRRMQDVDDDTFDQAMSANDCEVPRVAQQLGVSRAAVYRRIEASPHYCLASEVSPQELQRLMAEHAGDTASVARELRVSLNSLRSQLRKLPAEQH
ncbi:MAG: sigma-54-dependent Fis family transcriptional regulator [Halioglobus sp.]|nr:sigma-54-dependent Fis family transcriptional regulator [Halioglobus sp.]